MHKIIEAVAQKMKIPYWWVEAISIEYTECRDFATRDEIWTFNFDKLSEKDLEVAVQSHRVVVYGTLFHNVHNKVASSRILELMAGETPVSLAEEPDDIIAEGLVSEYHFPFLGNSIEVWDPKLSFSKHFQVLDDGHFWQWHITDFVSVAGRNYGKWISSEIDLEPLDKIHEKLASLRNPVIKPGEPRHSEFKTKVEEFYKWLDQIRRPILSALLDIHAKKRQAHTNPPKVTTSEPPLLSRYEKFTVRNGEMYTKLLAEPVFFRSCRQHANKAEELAKSADSSGELIHKLDEIYRERASAIIFGAACLEAFINNLGFEHFPDLWKNVENLALEAKWHLFLSLKSEGSTFNLETAPYQIITELTKKRNQLIHFKPQYEKVSELYNRAATVHEKIMNREFVRDLPDRISRLIRKFSKDNELPIPAWLTLCQI